MNCPNCGQTLIRGDEKCWMCGVELTEGNVQTKHFCPKCGKPVESSGLLCSECRAGKLIPKRKKKKKLVTRMAVKAEDMRLDYFQAYKGMLTFDDDTYHKIIANRPWKLLIEAYIILFIINTVFGLATNKLSALPDMNMGWMIGLSIASIFGGLVFFVLYGFLIQIFLKIFNGSGKFSDTMLILSAVAIVMSVNSTIISIVQLPFLALTRSGVSYAFIAITGMLSALSIANAIYAVALSVFGLKTLHNTSSILTAICIVLSMGIIFGIIFALISAITIGFVTYMSSNMRVGF